MLKTWKLGHDDGIGKVDGRFEVLALGFPAAAGLVAAAVEGRYAARRSGQSSVVVLELGSHPNHKT